MARDPQAVLDTEPMSRTQWATVVVMVGLNALDGFDVLSISFASPGIAKAWGVDRAALGLVLSMELIGMALGSLALGGIADRIGRRATILGCLVVMTGGMLGAATAHNIELLSSWRLLTGIGIGGMLAATNAAVAEAANARRRSLCVVLMAAGYPLGTIVGGSIAAVLLGRYGCLRYSCSERSQRLASFRWCCWSRPNRFPSLFTSVPQGRSRRSIAC